MISINATLVVQIINFLILIWILNHILFRPIFRIIEEREAFVEDTKAEVGRIEAEAIGKLKTYEDRMNTAREEALARRVEARDEAAASAREIMNRASAEAQEHISAIHAEAAKAVQEVKTELADFKESIAELVLAKIIGREAQ
jgi:F-type H+-transporting ATPase subunit b